MSNNDKIFGYQCRFCKHIYSDLEIMLAKFDPCVKCGNTFKLTGKYDFIYSVNNLAENENEKN